ncbi:MAG: hypothetical protein H0W81_05590 [Chloroflexi bacterium]|nr:hypothetical protein [Chloroflexota bacterium]
MPVFENGWICRECWSANREQDSRCYRCHAVPKRRETPAASTFSTPDGMPKEERKKVTSLTGTPAAARVEPIPPEPAVPIAPRAPRRPIFMPKLRAANAAVAHGISQARWLFRVVMNAPGAGITRLTTSVRSGTKRVSGAARGAASHKRAWLSAAWIISAFSCALLFSVALRAPLAASLLVVASVAIFSGLTSAITTDISERQGRSTDKVPPLLQELDEV